MPSKGVLRSLLGFAAAVVGFNKPVTPPIEPERATPKMSTVASDSRADGKPYRIFQELRTAQRLFVDIPAGHGEWVDTGLSPQALGGRRVKIGWWAALAMPKNESPEMAKAWVDNVSVRVVADPGRAVDWKYYKVDEKDPEGVTFVASGAEVSMKSGSEYSFLSEPGRIEVKLARSRPSDVGTVRTAYQMSRVAADDILMVKSSVDKWESYDLDVEEFPDPPPIPDPTKM